MGSARETSSGQISLHLFNTEENEDASKGGYSSSEPFDFVFAASGYERRIYQGLIEPARDLLDDLDGQMTVDKGYRINFKRKEVACDTGIWVIDGLEKATDDAFRYMGLRTERILQSLLTECEKCKQLHKASAEQSVVEVSVL
jgi:lysine/ornithine N-monooxygenase